MMKANRTSRMKMMLFVREERSANMVMIAMRVCYVEDERGGGGGGGGGGETKKWRRRTRRGLVSLKSERLTEHCGKSWRLTNGDQMGQRARPAADVIVNPSQLLAVHERRDTKSSLGGHCLATLTRIHPP
jgi:hypothetical protein